MSDYIYRCYGIIYAMYKSILFEKVSFDELDANVFETTEHLASKYPIRQIQLELDYYTEGEGDAEISIAMNFFEHEGPNDVKTFIRTNIGVALEEMSDLEIIDIDLDFY